MSAGFAHLHCHTEYSVLDGACKTHELLEKCKTFGMSSCAITDHGVLFGAVEFYQAAKKADIKPIIGCELYVAKDGCQSRSGRSGNYNHFLMLCENLEGYRNLCKLSSLGFQKGFYYRPRVDDELLARHKSGLITTSSCLAGQIPQAILDDDLDGANTAVLKYVEMFGKDNFLIELMDHGMPEQKKVNPILAELAEKHELMMIATNDCHYVNKEDAESHDALLCIQTNALIDDPDRFRFSSDELYFRSPDEMREVFTDWPEAVSNTEKIAERCNLELPLGQHLIPEFKTPDDSDKIEFLRRLIYEGLEARYEAPVPEPYQKRADFELKVIGEMGFVDYFLVVWDLIEHARSQGIPVGPGRGSGAGSIVAYALQITNIDPMRYNLLFERFLNPERISMPDFDIDFCYVRREEMIEYARNKYGEKNVSQIITFGRMLAKMVVRNVGRVMGMPYGEVDRIAKLIPDELKITLDSAYKKQPELKEIVDSDPQVGRLWKLAKRLEGTINNCGTHAAGVVICDKDLTDYVALYQAAGTDTVATQVEMKALEEVGLLKMDFLGLRTLTVIHETVRLIGESRGVTIDIDAIEPDDSATYALLRSGQTTGVFQLESTGMRDVARRIGLESLEEICALVALYRPGPMEFIDQYIKHKHNPDTIRYDHPMLEAILGETYGIAVYQEQVMQIVQALAGFSLGQADILRRAMGKKNVELMAQQKVKFVEGCVKNDIDEALAESLYKKIETFAGYGFNKSHSVAYAFVAYQTAFLKAHYPAEFMAALLTSESGNLDKVAIYVEECRRLNIEVLPPDVNHSHLQFHAEGNTIRFGLRAIKNVGEAPANGVVQERMENGPYKDIYDFCERLDAHWLNRRLVESLNNAGAFEESNWSRAEIDVSIERAMEEAQIVQRERAAGQGSLLDLLGPDDPSASVHERPHIQAWTDAETLAREKLVLGLYVSSHPLEEYRSLLDRFTTPGLDALNQFPERKDVIAGGILSEIKLHTTAKGKRMAFVTLETLNGSYELTIFSDTFEEHRAIIVQDTILIIPSTVNYRNGQAGLIASDIIPIQEAEKRLAKALHLRLYPKTMKNGQIEELAHLLGARPGLCDVYLHCETEAEIQVTVHATSSCRVAISDELVLKVADVVGNKGVWLSAASGLPRHS